MCEKSNNNKTKKTRIGLVSIVVFLIVVGFVQNQKFIIKISKEEAESAHIALENVNTTVTTILNDSSSSVSSSSSSFSSQNVGTATQTGIEDQQQGNEDEDEDENDNEIINTAIIITSSWIPTLPTLSFINKVMESLKLLIGLNLHQVPIYITVDGLKLKVPKTKVNRNAVEDYANSNTNAVIQDYLTKQQQLDEYIEMLHHQYGNQSNIHIVVSTSFRHISGNVQKVLRLIESHHSNNNISSSSENERTNPIRTSSIEFVYYIQHDFVFDQPIYHNALIDRMQNETGNKKQVNLVRFMWNQQRLQQSMPCPQTSDISIPVPPSAKNGSTSTNTNVTLTTTTINLKSIRTWSDNNHLARLDYYKNVINGLGPAPRPPEDPITVHRESKCPSTKGIWMYTTTTSSSSSSSSTTKNKNDQYFTLQHLDGRLTTTKTTN